MGIGPLPFLAPARQVKSFPFSSSDAFLSHSLLLKLISLEEENLPPPAGQCLEVHPSFHSENMNSQGGDPLKDSFRSFSKSTICWCLKVKLLEPQSSLEEYPFLSEVLPLRNSRA